MVYAESSILPLEWDPRNSQRFWDKNRLPNPGYKTRPGDNKKKREPVA